jgi:hypothetical protein
MFERIKTLFDREPPRPKMGLISISSFDPEEMPLGFFNVETASGRKSLGYRGGFSSYDVGETVVDGGKRITLDKKREELPTVKLPYGQHQSAGGHTVLDTESLESNDGEVSWDGAQQLDGVQWR